MSEQQRPGLTDEAVIEGHDLIDRAEHEQEAATGTVRSKTLSKSYQDVTDRY